MLFLVDTSFLFSRPFIYAQLAGTNSHHIIEATFKAFARALRQATEYDPRRRGTVPRSSVSQTDFLFYTNIIVISLYPCPFPLDDNKVVSLLQEQMFNSLYIVRG